MVRAACFCILGVWRDRDPGHSEGTSLKGAHCQRSGSNMGHEEVQSLAWPGTLGSGIWSLCEGRNCFFLSPEKGCGATLWTIFRRWQRNVKVTSLMSVLMKKAWPYTAHSIFPGVECGYLHAASLSLSWGWVSDLGERKWALARRLLSSCLGNLSGHADWSPRTCIYSLCLQDSSHFWGRDFCLLYFLHCSVAKYSTQET